MIEELVAQPPEDPLEEAPEGTPTRGKLPSTKLVVSLN